MKQAGIKIIYSQQQIKIHSKIAVIKKQSGMQTLSYAILSTGNFNEITAQFYTDHVLMTSDPSVINELLSLFEFLQKRREVVRNKIRFEKFLVSQFNMLEKFEALINAEIQKAKRGESALIRIKINNLEEPHLISLLYKASEAGVKVNLIIRSVCCLIPGASDMSSNITVKRLVDRFLEHTRLFIFGTGENAVVIMGSADWMNRNIHHRIEVCVIINDSACKKELVDYFDMQWNDNEKIVELKADLEQKFFSNAGAHKYNAQQSIYQYLKERV